MVSIGIGGNIGSGKTTVAKELVKCYQKNDVKVKLIDADSIAWKLYKRNMFGVTRSAIYDKIIKAFGNSILDKKNEIDRKKLGKLVFDNNKLLGKLNKIVHPDLIRRLNTELKKTDASVKVLDAALLFFWGKKIRVSYRILVTSSDKQKVARMAKRGYNSKEVKTRLKQQMKESEMEKISDFIVRNDGTLNQLRKKVEFLYQILKD